MNNFNAIAYEDVISIGHWLYEGSQIRIQGTKEEPLFNCLDVAKVLGYTKAN
jgi:hypothetical protein